jgi:hypothetical protein
VSLQARVRPSIQAELDLHTAKTLTLNPNRQTSVNMKVIPTLFLFLLSVIDPRTSCYSAKSDPCVTWSKPLSNSLRIDDIPGKGLTHDLNPDSDNVTTQSDFAEYKTLLG